MDEIRWTDKQGDECEIRDATLSHAAGRIIIVIYRGESEVRPERCVYVTDEAEEKLCDALNERREEHRAASCGKAVRVKQMVDEIANFMMIKLIGEIKDLPTKTNKGEER